MFELIYRFDPAQRLVRHEAASSAEARQLLVRGNHDFVEMTSSNLTDRKTRVVPFNPHDFGWGLTEGDVPQQAPSLPSSAAPTLVSQPRCPNRDDLQPGMQ